MFRLSRVSKFMAKNTCILENDNFRNKPLDKISNGKYILSRYVMGSDSFFLPYKLTDKFVSYNNKSDTFTLTREADDFVKWLNLQNINTDIQYYLQFRYFTKENNPEYSSKARDGKLRLYVPKIMKHVEYNEQNISKYGKEQPRPILMEEDPCANIFIS